MTSLHIQRDHGLGQDAAQEVAQRWVRDAQQRLGLTCRSEWVNGISRIHFTRTGVTGYLDVTAQRFELQAQLGFLLSGFAPAIEAQIRQNLDELLGPALPPQ